MVMDAGKALCVHLHDGYVMSNKTRWGTHYFEWPLQKQKAVAHLSKAPRKSLLIKAMPCPFIILLCIISMLQLSVAIRLAFFMQINLTAQQSVSYANSCLSFSPLHSLAQVPPPPPVRPPLSLSLPPFHLIFSGICRGWYICIIYSII